MHNLLLHRFLFFTFIIILLSVNHSFAQMPMGQTPLGGRFSNMGGTGSGNNKNGKLLNDSLKVIYGPKTTRFFYEVDVFNNRKVLHTVDTLLAGFHLANFVQRNGNLYTDLANFGTASHPVFYLPPNQIGANVGQNAFDLYCRTPAQIKYFNTRSPFTNMYFAPMGSGQNILDFDFNRNINPRFNAGFNVRRITAIRQFGPPYTSEDNLLGIWDLSLHSNYESKNGKYTVMGYLQYFTHKENDQGGIVHPTGWKKDTLLQLSIDLLTAKLGRSAGSEEKRTNFHVYHQYKLSNGFQVYHTFDIQGRSFRYQDTQYKQHLSFYHPTETALPKSDTLQQLTYYSLVENKVGIKGFYKGFNYRLHLRRRDYVWQDSLQNFKTQRNENYVGVWLNYYFPDSLRKAWAMFEYLIPNGYQLQGEYQSPKFVLGFQSMLHAPTLLQQRYQSSLQNWNNGFENVFVNHAYISTTRQFGKIRLSPSFSYSLVKNYVYFDTSATAQQTAAPFSIFRAGLGLDWQRGKFSTTNQAYYNRVEGNQVIRMPNWLVNSRLAYDFLYAKVLYIQAGLEMHYRSGYYADAYNPMYQTFYLNNSFEVPASLTVDAFAVLRINRVRLFFKMSNVTNKIIQQGYYTSPYYPAIGRTFGFGVNWPLFD
jgi:Putative porin